MLNTPTLLIEEASKWIGYLEKDSNTNLSHFTEHASDKNFTYFADWLSKYVDRAIYANGHAWCDTFVDFCFCRAYGIEKAKELLGGFSAYTPTSAVFFKAMDQWFASDPKPGDIIFFKNTKRINHTGIVIKTDGTKIYTIEGNTSSGNHTVIENGGCVAKKSYLKTNKNIAGYGRPKYDMTLPEMPFLSGIDCSSYQGCIDWEKVKSSGIDFAILRGILKNGSLDTSFEQNYEACTHVGIPCAGVYHFSYALEEQTAVADAQNMIARLKGKKLPIWLDLEWIHQGLLGKDKVTSIAAAYVNTCKSLGYTCHIYSNLDWFKHKYHAAQLQALGCKLWIARYSSKDNGTLPESLRPNVSEAIWQYSSKGTVAGIAGPVDLNIMYVPLSTILDNSSTNSSQIG